MFLFLIALVPHVSGICSIYLPCRKLDQENICRWIVGEFHWGHAYFLISPFLLLRTRGTVIFFWVYAAGRLRPAVAAREPKSFPDFIDTRLLKIS